MQEKQHDFEACLIGIERTGKTTLLSLWNNEEYEEVYEKTEDVESKIITQEINNVSLTVNIWDCPGKFFTDSSGTVDKYLTEKKVHIFVVKRDDEGSVSFLKGYIDSFLYKKYSVNLKYLIVTKSSGNEDDQENEEEIKSLVDEFHMKRFDVECDQNAENVRKILVEIMKDYIKEFNVPVTTKIQNENTDKNNDDNKKNENDKNENTKKEKQSCCVLL